MFSVSSRHLGGLVPAPGLIAGSGLRFPEGMATLATLQQIYSQGAEAGRRLWVLGSAALAAGTKLIDTFF